MANFEDRQQQYEQNDVPAAWRAYVASGIRKKFADQFDFGTMSDQDVIQHHHDRFGAGMSPEQYGAKLDKTYGTGFTPPAGPKKTLADRAADVGEAGKAVATGLAPFVVPEVGKGLALKAGAKAVATKIPLVSQVGFLGGHAINEAVDTATAAKLEQTAAALPVPDEAAKTQEFYDKLAPSLSAKGYSTDQIMQEARARAQNVTRGYQKTTESIDKDVEATQQQAVTEPARAAADAFFLGVGAPVIEGAIQRGLAKVGLIKTASAVGSKAAPSLIGTVASHIKTGAVVGAPGMAIQQGISAGVAAAAQNKTPQEIGQALVKGGTEGLKEGALGGAVLGGLAGATEIGLGAAIKPFAERVRAKEFKESQAQVALDNARLRGWQEYDAEQRSRDIVRADQRRSAIMRTADNFDPHTTTSPIDGDPAEVATTIIQQDHGEDAALSETGMRAASKIEERLRLYQDAQSDLSANTQRELPPSPAAPVGPQPGDITGSEMPPTEQAPPALGPPLGPVEQGGRAIPPAEEIHPLKPAAPAPPEAPAPVAPPAPTPQQNVEAALAPVRAGTVTGHTFNPNTFEEDKTPGYVVSLVSHNVKNLTPEGILKFKERVQPWITKMEGEGKHTSIGVFALEDKPGTFSIDLNVNTKTPEEAMTIGRQTNQESFAHIGPDGNWIENIRVTPAEKAATPTAAPKAPPTVVGRAIGEIKVGKHADLTEGPDGELHIARLGLPTGEAAKPGALGKSLDAIVRKADEHQLPVTTQITQTPGPRGGMIPIEKLLPWYEQRGFKLVDSTKLPEGQMATAVLRREPTPPPAKKMDMLEAQRVMMERATTKPSTPAARELAAPATTPAPGRWHQTDLWADSNITAARERIKAREAEFPLAERKRAGEAGFIGEKANHRDPTSYDWADFADRVQIGVNVMLKHGLNKAEWVEHMVRELGGKFRDIADRVYQESVASYNARRPKGLDEVRQVVDDYVHQIGLGRGATRHDVYPELNARFSERVAQAYHSMENAKPGTPEYRDAELSYKALNHEVEQQYEAMVKAGYKVSFTADDPYPTSADMRADVAKNKHIKAFKTPEGHHPFMTTEQNDKFRAVHDFFGHAAEGYEFGPRGEDAAFLKHASTLSNAAVPALATETRGQNSWVNYWPANAKLSPKERPFAEQKLGLLPSWVYDDVVSARTRRAPPNRLGSGFPSRKGAEGAFEQAATALSRGVRPAKSPTTVRARFVANGTDTINEMMAVSPESANWYHDDIARMHKMVAEHLPEVGTPGGQALFDLLLGFTSPQKPVVDNFATAYQMMQDYTKTGKVPLLRRFGQEINPASRNWVPRLNALIEKHGGDLDAMRDYLLTKSDNGKYNVEREFGPKVGPFTLNIQGIHDQITVDAWMVRRLRRLSGQMFKTGGDKRVLNRDEAPLASEQRDIEEGIRELSRKTGLDPDAIQAILWDNEKMVWERAGHAAPRIPFSRAAEGVFTNMGQNAREIDQALHPNQMRLWASELIPFLKRGKTIS